MIGTDAFFDELEKIGWGGFSVGTGVGKVKDVVVKGVKKSVKKSGSGNAAHDKAKELARKLEQALG